jgi:hypothetical protein
MQIERIEDGYVVIDGLKSADARCGMKRKERRALLAESGAANKSASCVVLGVNKAKIGESHWGPAKSLPKPDTLQAFHLSRDGDIIIWSDNKLQYLITWALIAWSMRSALGQWAGEAMAMGMAASLHYRLLNWLAAAANTFTFPTASSS